MSEIRGTLVNTLYYRERRGTSLMLQLHETGAMQEVFAPNETDFKSPVQQYLDKPLQISVGEGLYVSIYHQGVMVGKYGKKQEERRDAFYKWEARKKAADL
jgi:hypothetical protein